MTDEEVVVMEQDETAEAAQEAAQHVVDGVTSWHASAPDDTKAAELEQGLQEAGVDLPQAEKDSLVEDIEEGQEAPDVSGDATPR